MSSYDNFKASVARKNTIPESVHELLNQVSTKLSHILSADGDIDREELAELQGWVDRDRDDIYDAVVSNTHEGNAAMSLAKRDDRAEADTLVPKGGRAPAPRQDLRPRDD